MPVLSNLIVRIGASTDDFDKQLDRALNKTRRLATTAVEAGTALAMGFSAPLIAARSSACSSVLVVRIALATGTPVSSEIRPTPAALSFDTTSKW